MIASVATACGRAIGRYGRLITSARHPEYSLADALDDDPCIWIGWHEFNLITIAAHRAVMKRPVAALALSGLSGQAMRGWLEASDVLAIPLRTKRETGTALRAMRRALRDGYDILIAVDGPSGPRRQVKPGALWLAAVSGAPIRPVAAAARPALRLPRWDRHAVPLPGASIRLAAGEILRLPDNPKNADFAAEVGITLNRLTDEAGSALRSPDVGTLEEVT